VISGRRKENEEGKKTLGGTKKRVHSQTRRDPDVRDRFTDDIGVKEGARKERGRGEGPNNRISLSQRSRGEESDRCTGIPAFRRGCPHSSLCDKKGKGRRLGKRFKAFVLREEKRENLVLSAIRRKSGAGVGGEGRKAHGTWFEGFLFLGKGGRENCIPAWGGAFPVIGLSDAIKKKRESKEREGE